MFSPSAQYTEAANKARRLIFMIRRSFQDLWKSAFILFYGALVRLHLEHGMPAFSPNFVADINDLERIQKLATSLVTGMRHVPYEDLSSLPFEYWSELVFFLPLARRGLRGHPYKLLQGASHHRWRGSAFSVRVVKYWNKFPASVVTALSVNVSKKTLEKIRTEIFPHLPHWLNTHLPISNSPPAQSHLQTTHCELSVKAEAIWVSYNREIGKEKKYYVRHLGILNAPHDLLLVVFFYTFYELSLILPTVLRRLTSRRT